MANSLNTITVDGVTYDYNEYMASLNAKTNNRNDALGKDAFLQLLVTQMQYQDPLDPQDNSEYLSQLAQFSALEQMSNVSSSLEKVNTLIENIDTSVLVGQLSGMIGKEVQWTMTSSTTDENGNVNYVTSTLVGDVTGVSISDGAPSLVAKVKGDDGTEYVYKVAVGDIISIREK
ncbi:MAG: flagellar hook capping FlgD N-terminal domain-containing protein [Selenomonadaceae bacterium]|nr:flagellar hook capping FlgD N-terminal domain-containing protein [Selenomonadaceae bacterium]